MYFKISAKSCLLLATSRITKNSAITFAKYKSFLIPKIGSSATRSDKAPRAKNKPTSTPILSLSSFFAMLIYEFILIIRILASLIARRNKIAIIILQLAIESNESVIGKAVYSGIENTAKSTACFRGAKIVKKAKIPNTKSAASLGSSPSIIKITPKISTPITALRGFTNFLGNSAQCI